MSRTLTFKFVSPSRSLPEALAIADKCMMDQGFQRHSELLLPVTKESKERSIVLHPLDDGHRILSGWRSIYAEYTVRAGALPVGVSIGVQWLTHDDACNTFVSIDYSYLQDLYNDGKHIFFFRSICVFAESLGVLYGLARKDIDFDKWLPESPPPEEVAKASAVFRTDFPVEWSGFMIDSEHSVYRGNFGEICIDTDFEVIFRAKHSKEQTDER
ncbi:MAG: hypothetical protein AAGF11_51975 [Myxococcota bacterium]